MVMGRANKGIDHVESCDGSELSKHRTRVILQTIRGDFSVNEACEQLGIQRPRFAELRAKALQGSIDAIEPGRPGRPRIRDVEQDQRETELLTKIEDLEQQLKIAEVRAMLAEVRLSEKKGLPPKWQRGLE